MKLLYCAVLIPLLTLANVIAAQCPVYSQSSDGGTTYGTAPVYSQENFKGDARAANLYKSQNPVAQIQPTWNSYQTQVRQLKSQVRSQTPVQSASQSANTSSLTGYRAGVSIFAGVSGLLMNSSSKLLNGSGSGNNDASEEDPFQAKLDGLAGTSSATGTLIPDTADSSLDVNAVLQSASTPGLTN